MILQILCYKSIRLIDKLCSACLLCGPSSVGKAFDYPIHVAAQSESACAVHGFQCLSKVRTQA